MSRKKHLGKAIKAPEATDMVPMHTVKEYFNDIVTSLGLDKGARPSMSDMEKERNKLLKAFQQELYGRISFKLGPEALEMTPDDLADLAGIQSILQETFRKWRRLCILCSEKGLGNWLRLEDLQEALKDGPSEVVMPNPDEDVTDQLDEILPPGEKPVYLEEVPNEQSAAEEPG